jgi:dihydrofolate reductase
MREPRVSIIAAISKNRVLGRNNDLIWRIPEDLKRFKELTSGHAIIMGRKTFESIGRALPNRTNIIITRDPNFSAPGCVIEHSLDTAIAKAKTVEPMEIFIIGGGQVYKEAIDIADKLYLTIVDAEAQGDVWFPDYSKFKAVWSGEEKTFQGLSFRHINFEKTAGT